MKYKILLILLIISNTILSQKNIKFKTDYFSGSFEYYNPNRAMITTFNKSIEIELDYEMITVNYVEKTNDSIFDLYLKQLNLIFKNKNFNLTDFGKTSIKDRKYYWLEFSKSYKDGGFPEADVNLVYLTKFKDSFILIKSHIFSPKSNPNQSELIKLRKSYSEKIKNILKTFEFK